MYVRPFVRACPRRKILLGVPSALRYAMPPPRDRSYFFSNSTSNMTFIPAAGDSDARMESLNCRPCLL